LLTIIAQNAIKAVIEIGVTKVKYLVKFYNPEKPGSGFIDAYRLARNAKLAVEKFNALYDKEGRGIRAEYLGRRKP
jgi:hypothetical protein